MIRIALSVINDRLITILALIATFVLSLWIMREPDLIRLGAGVIFAIFSYLLVRNKEKKDGGNERQRQEREV